MEIADFEPERFVFEIRYADAYMMWDRAGAATKELQREFPTLSVSEGNPAKVTFVMKPNVEIVFENGKAFAIVYRPRRSAEDLMVYATALVNVVISKFDVSGFTRVGTRLIYDRSFSSLSDATNRLLSFNMIKVPEGRLLNQKGALHQCDYRYRWEGDATGVAVGFRAETEIFEMAIPPQHVNKLEDIKKTTHRVVVDVDYYATAVVLAEQLKVDEWIKNAVHLVNRDLKQFMKVEGK